MTTAETVQLTLRDITADSPPGTLLDVYLQKKNQPASRVLVGTVSWFGAFRHHGQAGPAHRTLAYDVTAALRDLGGTSLADSGVTVVIAASTGTVPVAGATAAKAVRAPAATGFRPEANVRIGAIELRAGAP